MVQVKDKYYNNLVPKGNAYARARYGIGSGEIEIFLNCDWLNVNQSASFHQNSGKSYKHNENAQWRVQLSVKICLNVPENHTSYDGLPLLLDHLQTNRYM